MNPTNIPWTHLFGPGSGFTWNPITGCSAVSPGCANCYARTLHNQRHEAFKQGKAVPECYATPFHDVRFHPDRLDQPMHRRKPAGVFVCSMSDLFHKNVTDEQLLQIFAVMAACHKHIFFVLTKRPERMREFITKEDTAYNIAVMSVATRKEQFQWPLPNVWLGVTAEDQQRADERIPILLDTPAAVRFVSVEPMLGEFDMAHHFWPQHLWKTNQIAFAEKAHEHVDCMIPMLDWVIAGGESGPGSRPAHPDWFRSMRDQCKAAGVPYFHKQNGGAGRNHGGHLLDGQEHREFPEVKP